MYAVWNTNLAASTGVIGWVGFQYIFHGRKFTVIGACEGCIAGLVGITPAAGFVTVWYAAAIGFITAIVICLFENVNVWLRIDDGLKVFKLHGIGGMCGAFLTGIFATAKISALDGIPTIVHGGVDGNGVQIAKQMAEIAAIFAWSFTLSIIMLMILKYTPGMHLRVPDEIEEIGLDMDQFADEAMGEWSMYEGQYDTAEGHHRRSMQTGAMHGVPVPDTNAQSSEGSETTEEKAEASKH